MDIFDKQPTIQLPDGYRPLQRRINTDNPLETKPMNETTKKYVRLEFEDIVHDISKSIESGEIEFSVSVIQFNKDNREMLLEVRYKTHDKN